MSLPRILVVDDEAELRHALVRALAGHDYAVREAPDGAAAVREFSAFKPDVVLLDLVLPDMTGVEVCREIGRLRDTPIIVLSVLGEERAKVDALDAGADDYLTKPFGMDELLARVRVALRRGASGRTQKSVIRVDGLSIDLERRRVAVEDREIRLSPTEYSLLTYLATHAGKVLTYPMILRAVWGEEYSDSMNVLRTAVNQLRIRLGDSASSPQFIRTHTGVGYQFADPEPDHTSIAVVADSVHRERPDISVQPEADGTVTLMFSDIEDSTVLTERLGDRAWQELLRRHNAIIRKQIRAHDGFEVKTMGDGFMVAFQSAKKGLACAIAIQRAFAEHEALHGEHVRVRIGLHAGEAIREADDFYGKNVILASRVADQATGGEILVSSLLRQLVHSSIDPSIFGEPREVELKGLSGTHTVYPVRWSNSPS